MDTNRTYSVYTHKVVTDDKGPMWYVGVTKNVKKRWRPSCYKKHCLIGQCIEKYGWENMEHRVIVDGLDYEMARKLETYLIGMYRSADCCLNQIRSFNDSQYQKEYYTRYNKDYYAKHREENQKNCKEYYKENRAKLLDYHKALLSTPEGKIYNRVKAFNQSHPDRMIETALEARDKYLQTGYIPDYVKNCDLINEDNTNNNE